jgi:hypothetical protein
MSPCGVASWPSRARPVVVGANVKLMGDARPVVERLLGMLPRG